MPKSCVEADISFDVVLAVVMNNARRQLNLERARKPETILFYQEKELVWLILIIKS